MPKRIRTLLRDNGFIFERRNKHIVYRHAVTRQIITMSYTSASPRREQNIAQQIRRALREQRS